MTVRHKRKKLLGSFRQPIQGERLVARFPEQREIEVSVRLRPGRRDKQREANLHLLAQSLASRTRTKPIYLERNEYQERFAASMEDVQLVTKYAKHYNLKKVESCCADRLLTFKGHSGDMERAFGTKLNRYESLLGHYRGRKGDLYLPSDLIRVIHGVFGLDHTPQSKPYAARIENPRPATAGTRFEQIRNSYKFPLDFEGKGECIGILEFGGGISPDDYRKYFKQVGVQAPLIKFKFACGAYNDPNRNSRADEEVALDTEIAGLAAPQANIVVYFAPNTSRGWIHALSMAVHDTSDNPTVLSISWGATEDWWTEMSRRCLNEILCEAACLGITVCVASGDDGCATDPCGRVRATFPASSPFVMSIGGTTFENRLGRQYPAEVVWNERGRFASGGGQSDFEPRPKWQRRVKPTAASNTLCRRDPHFRGRLVPDVAGLASRVYTIYTGAGYVDGMGGTSAATPLWAGLIARLNEKLRPKGRCVGYITPRLYREARFQRAFRDIQQGTNDPNLATGYKADDHWDACTGWGSPNGQALLDVLLKS